MKIKDTLGMGQNIARRQFINGFAYSVSAAALCSAMPGMATLVPSMKSRRVILRSIPRSRSLDIVTPFGGKGRARKSLQVERDRMLS